MADEIDFDFGDNVDKATFSQILDMDEDEDKDFSKSIVFGFLDQAETTFEKMESERQAKNLDELSKLGHFLKGSSATLGFTKVKDECEKIQHFGHHKDATGENDETDDEKLLKLIGTSIEEAKTAYETVKLLMTQYYAEFT